MQPLHAVDSVQVDEILGRAGVDLPAALPRVDERAGADLREYAGAVRADLAEELRDHAERQVVRFDAPVDGERPELWHERPVSADRSSHQALVREAVEAAVLAVARRGGEHEREVLRAAGLAEARLERADKRLRRAGTDETRDRDGVAIAYERERLFGGDDLVLHDRPRPPRGCSAAARSAP